MTPHRNSCALTARWIIALLVCAGQFSLVAYAEQVADSVDDEPRERLLMLKTGRILSGMVSRNGGGYLVEQPNGRLQVGVDEVQFVVDNLREGYRKLRDSVVHPTPASHVDLATWCISHRLYDEAQDELKKSLKADPENEQARRLLQRLTDTMRVNLPPAGIPSTPRKSAEGFLQPAVESLGGLSRETATQFTSRIQPLLLNKCGNAACHGMSSPNEFRLLTARIGGNGSRQTTEKNLAETMRYIDLDDVAGSPLVNAGRNSHGGRGTIFVGPAGAEQMKLLRAWALAVAREKQAEAAELRQAPALAGFNPGKGKKKRVTQAVLTSDAEVVAVDTIESETERGDDRDKIRDDEPEEYGESETPSGSGRGTRPRELEEGPRDPKATAMKPFDAFDPEIFNRRLQRP